jgi:hypothetical protein
MKFSRTTLSVLALSTALVVPVINRRGDDCYADTRGGALNIFN